jgi:serine/threonine-protein kinase
VFLLEDGSIKLLDFGIAKLTSSTLTRQGDVLGSASYMSPEQVSGGESVDGRADIFSTGVVLYELLAGRKPFVADSPTAVILKILKEDPTPIETLVTGLPPELVAAVMRALSKDPDQRFATADAFGRELQQIRKSLHPSVSTSQLDETRFASTMVMKALHQDLQQAGGKTGTLAGATKISATKADTAPSRPAWLIPAGVGAVVVASIVAFLLMSRSAPPVAANPSTTTAANGSATPTAPGATKAAPATPSTAPPAATPPPTAGTPAPPVASSAAPPATAPATATADPVTPKTPAEPKKGAPVINVNLTGAYAFEVFDGAKAISAASTSHDLKQPVGKTLRISAPKYFLNQSIKVEGSTNQPFEFAAPALGSLDVRSVQETCDVMIGTQKLGNPPLLVEIAAGQYKIDLSCGGQVVKTHFATVRAGQTYVAAIR